MPIPIAKRPRFSAAWNFFKEVNLTVDEVLNLIGGHILLNKNVYKNACPIRMSYVLNKLGIPVPIGHGYHSSSGADGKNYIVRVSDMNFFLRKLFGEPDKTVKNPATSSFAGLQGILLVQGHGWGNASGHVTLWNKTGCSDTCHLLYDPANGFFVPQVAYLWKLP